MNRVATLVVLIALVCVGQAEASYAPGGTTGGGCYVVTHALGSKPVPCPVAGVVAAPVAAEPEPTAEPVAAPEPVVAAVVRRRGHWGRRGHRLYAAVPVKP